VAIISHFDFTNIIQPVVLPQSDDESTRRMRVYACIVLPQLQDLQCFVEDAAGMPRKLGDRDSICC
jgi:hypothetical protein